MAPTTVGRETIGSEIRIRFGLSSLCGLLFNPNIRLTQRTLLWTSTAAGVTASVDETVPGRMYSGMVRSCACLTMQAPVWTPSAQARSRRGERCEGIAPVRPGAWAFSCLESNSLASELGLIP
jgi:hypothetical protein